jgi:transposase
MTKFEKIVARVRYQDKMIRNDLRNISMAIERVQGKTYREIAKDYNLSIGRTQDLVQLWLRKAERRLSAKKESAFWQARFDRITGRTE